MAAPLWVTWLTILACFCLQLLTSEQKMTHVPRGQDSWPDFSPSVEKCSSEGQNLSGAGREERFWKEINRERGCGCVIQL